jgi:hypothetical protein
MEALLKEAASWEAIELIGKVIQEGILGVQG